jgi:hypothetical protein
MRYFEFKKLFEINMSPGKLAQETNKIDAKVGIEFEMVVPNVDDYADEPEYEPDYSDNPAPTRIGDIVAFFDDGDYNSRRTIRELETTLRHDFEEWALETFYSRWEADKETFVYNYIKDHMTGEDVAEILGLDPDSIDAISRVQAEQAAEKIIEENSVLLDNIRNYEASGLTDDTDLEYEWLEETGLDSMSDVQEAYSGLISWVNYDQVDSDSKSSIEEIANNFSDAIGKPVKSSSSYHGTTRKPGTYVVEPDGSISAGSGEMGLEFVSPPMPVSEMIDDLKKVRKWAESVGAYTNKSTGLHINVSIPNYTDDKLDYVKLALLLGDKYVLEQFGRAANTYTASALGKIQDRVKNLSTDQVQGLFDQMRTGLNQLASRSIHGPSAKKYTSINPRGNYIEFRSPGGDWLSEDISTLVSTMMRFVVALDAAIDPSKYRKEYLSKLQKLLAPKSDDDPIEYFVKYSSGQLPKQALKSFIRQAQLQRKTKKEKPAGAPNGPIQYEIYDLNTGRVIQQIGANNDDEAINYFYRITPDEDRQHVEVRRARNQSQPQTPTLTAPETEPDANYAIVDRTNNQVVQWLIRNTRAEAERELQGTGLEHLYSVVEVQPRLTFHEFNYTVRNADTGSQAASIVATSRESAIRQFRQFIGQSSNNYELLDIDGQIVITSTDSRSAQQSGVADSEATHEIVDRRSLRRMFVFSAQSETEAANKFEEWLLDNGYPVDNEYFGWRRISSPIPGSTQDLLQQRAASQNQGEFTGQWRILIDGEEVHRFGGVGNVQADANRFATRWLLAQQRAGSLTISDSAEIELVPVMGDQRPS